MNKAVETAAPKEIEIIAPDKVEVVVGSVTCPKCAATTKFCPHCGGRFCGTEGCESADLYHREECRDQNNVGN